jgi:hypothetical protein
MEERILTRHPEKGKQGVRISRAKYDQMRAAIIATLRTRGEITFTDLAQAINAQLRGKFDGSIMWYVTTVKLDLEARKVIRRVPKTKPPQLRLA